MKVTTETKYCDEHGEYEAQKLTDLGLWSHCPKCEERREAERQAEEQEQAKRQRQRRVEQLRKQSGIPRRFAGLTLESFDANGGKAGKIWYGCKRYAENFEERLSMGGGLVFCGKPGTGKTHLACAIAEHVMREHCRSALFTSITDMAREVKATYSRDASKTEQQVISAYMEPDLLIIDEVGAQRGTETELLLAQEIIDKRYQEVRSTILISNLSEDELGPYIGERALDRMYEGGGAIFAFDWDSYRRNNQPRTFEQPVAATKEADEFPAGRGAST